ncbi:MAG TPA: ABC transporter ATP-binding protein [Alphaproteobacteria bacterium]|jgi:oligopeptide transport system ATP-binding protein|nr:ABC transporter ATP-binding protein [Alphaproteobacteria bacterium]MDP7426993.1 ABC transporter ATP-binding protein [Alphaproteobacteria bacterium]HJM49585.1 ABC transporter ATP-binding protein [Alphaproteobacteria bacterium]
MATVLQITDLCVEFATPEGPVRAVRGVDLELESGQTLGIVGESGCGKSQVFLSVFGLLAGNGQAAGSVRFEGREVLGRPAELAALRGDRMAMIFQDPMTSLNPYLRIGQQLAEVLQVHRGCDRRQARRRAVEVMGRVGLAEAERRAELYPHEFSGGMRQRVMIAMALLTEPALIVADEPTTALDVTVQAQILELFHDLRHSADSAIVLISNDLGVVAELCQQIAVMYAGRIVETGAAAALLRQPAHPYTQALLASVPRLDRPAAENLVAIEGQPPDLADELPGCAFAERCQHARPACQSERPALRPLPGGGKAACLMLA